MKLKINKLNIYDPNKSPKGLEVRFKLYKDGLLKIWIPGTNSWNDMKQNIIGAFFPVKYHGFRYQRKWFKWAKEFFDYLTNFEGFEQVETIRLAGHSMGGAVASIIKKLFIYELNVSIPDYRFFAIPRPRTKNNYNKVVANRGDITIYLPPQYKKHTAVIFTDRKPSWNIIKNHLDIEEMKEWKI